MTPQPAEGLIQQFVDVAPKTASVKPEDIDFDPNNPRFGKINNSNTSQPVLAQSLMGEPYFASELVDSFVENGFIPYEPLILRSIGDGRYMVIEGNRRLAAVKFIRANKAQYDPKVVSGLDTIPALIFDALEDNDRIRVYLGIRHLLGFRQWPAESKAVFLEKESKKTKDLSKLLKDIGLKKQEARRFLIPYRLLRQFGESVPAGQDFWMLAEAISRAGVKEYIQLDFDAQTLQIRNVDEPKFLKLLEFIYGKYDVKTKKRDMATRLVSETRDLTKLGKILTSKPALAALTTKRNLEQAYLYVDEDEDLINKIDTALSQLKVLAKRLDSVVDKKESGKWEAAKGKLGEFEDAYRVLKKKLNG